MKKFFTVFMFVMVSVMATAQCSVFYIEPTMRLNFNDREDVSLTVNKLRKAFGIEGEPTKYQHHLVFQQTPLLQSDITVHYLIQTHENNHNQLFAITIMIVGEDKGFIGSMIDTFDKMFYNSPLYEFNGVAYSNGQIWIGFEKTKEGNGQINIMPIK